jgi:serine protease Do
MKPQFTKCLTVVTLILALTVAVSAAETDLARVRQAEAARVKLVAELSRTVVAVFRQVEGNNQAGGGGSGVIIETDGTTLTNYHVVGNSKKVMVGTADGQLHDADVIGTDPTGDIAVIRIKDGPFPAARLGDSDKLEPGDWVLAMGNPFLLATDFAPTVSLGIVSGNHRYLPGTEDFSLIYTDCIQIDAAINPGNSGGPL